MASNRRSFLKTAGMATAVASAAPLALSLPDGVPGGPAIVSAAEGRTYTGGRFALDLGGSMVGILPAFSGGHPYGVVGEIGDGDGPARKKMIGAPKYEEIRFRAHPGLGEPLWSWISAMLAGKPQFKSGAIHLLDSALTATNMIEFEDALITEVTFPKLDGASKEIAYLDVVLTPLRTRLQPGKAKPPAEKKQKSWTTSNFTIKIGNLPTSRVSKVESFTIKQGVAETDPGERRFPVIEPTKIEYPNIIVTLSEVDGAPWFTYFDSFVVQGKNGPEDELEGAIELLSPDLKTTLASVSLSGAGLFRLDHSGSSEARPGKVPRTIGAEFYTNGIAFTGPPAG